MPVDPATLSIVHYPAPILRRRCAPVEAMTDEVRAVAVRMLEIMREAPGIGLAAPQVGLDWRLFVCHVPPDPDAPDQSLETDPPSATAGPLICLNPVLRSPVSPVESDSEGCLSLPGITGDIPRPRGITLEAVGLDGEPFVLCAGGLLARCIQHETDHLDGVLILDRMSHLSRLRCRAAVRRMERAAGVR